MDMENIITLMETIIKDIGKIIILKDLEQWLIVSIKFSILENGWMIYSMEKEYKHLQIGNIKVNSNKEKSMEMDDIPGMIIQ